jgi:RHS repeat-associated protein
LSKVGIGRFNNISFSTPRITAGGIDYIKRMAQLQRDRYNYYAALGVAPGQPTDKYYYAQPYNRGIASPILVDSTVSSIPAGWPGNTTPPLAGPPVFMSPIPGNDSVKAGYGFVGTGHFYEQNQYFYHPDHLGSTNYITNIFGRVCQHQEYVAYGEVFVDEHNSTDKMPYLFNAKERDDETGLYYFGARYYNPRMGLWLGVDPLVDKYPGVSPYSYCLGNPVKMVDRDGRAPDDVVDDMKGNYGLTCSIEKENYSPKSAESNTEEGGSQSVKAIHSVKLGAFYSIRKVYPGAELTYNAKDVDLCDVDDKGFHKEKTYGNDECKSVQLFHLKNPTFDGWNFGQITICKTDQENQVTIRKDEYNFEYHKGQGLSTRNILTLGGCAVMPSCNMIDYFTGDKGGPQTKFIGTSPINCKKK